MRTRTAAVVLFAVIVACTCMVEAVPGPGPCHSLVAQGANGQRRVVNFDQLWAASMDKPFKAMDPIGQWVYEFGICGDVPCGQGQTAAACQETSQPAYYGLGKYPTPITATLKNDIPLGSVVFTIPALGDPARASIITVHCDPKALQPGNFSVISAPPGSQPPFTYRLFLSHHSACGAVPATPGPCHNLQARSKNGTQVRNVNLDELSTLSSMAPFSALDINTGLSYLFGVCTNIPCTDHSIPSAGCVTTAAPFSFSLGPFPSQISATLITDGYIHGAIEIDVPIYQFQQLTVTIICDYNAATPTNAMVISPPDGSPPPWKYQFFLTHRSACGV